MSSTAAPTPLAHIGPFTCTSVEPAGALDVIFGADSLCDDWLLLLAEENKEAARLQEEITQKIKFPHVWRKVSYVRPERRQTLDFFNKTIGEMKEWKVNNKNLRYKLIGFEKSQILGLQEWLTLAQFRPVNARESANVVGVKISSPGNADEVYNPRDSVLLGLKLGLTRGTRFVENLATVSRDLYNALESLEVDGNILIEWGGLVHHPFILFLAKMLINSFRSVRVVGDPNAPDFIGCYVVGLGLKNAESPLEFLERFHRVRLADDALCWWLGMVESFAVFKRLGADFHKLFAMTSSKLAHLHEFMTVDTVALKARVLTKLRALRFAHLLFTDVHKAREGLKKVQKSSRSSTPASRRSPRKLPSSEAHATPLPAAAELSAEQVAVNQKSALQDKRTRQDPPSVMNPKIKSVSSTARQKAPKRGAKVPKPFTEPTEPTTQKPRPKHPEEDHEGKIERMGGRRENNEKLDMGARNSKYFDAGLSGDSVSSSEQIEKPIKKEVMEMGKLVKVPRLNLRLPRSLFDPSPLQVYDRQSLMAYSIPIPYAPGGVQVNEFRTEELSEDLRGVYKPEIPVVKTRNRILMQFKV